MLLHAVRTSAIAKNFMTTPIALFISVLTLAPLSAFASSYASWQNVIINGASPGLRSGHVGVPDPGSDAAIFFGGHAGDLVGLSDVWRFSFHGQLWSSLSPSIGSASRASPGGRFDHCGSTCAGPPSAQGVSAFAVFFGGASNASGGLWGDVWSLSFGSSPAWSQLQTTSAFASRPSPRANSACACVNASALLIFGGRDRDGSKNELWRFDLRLRTWSRLANGPRPVVGACMVAMSESQILVFGGFDSSNIATGDMWSVFPSGSMNSTSSAWRQVLTDVPVPARGFHGCIKRDQLQGGQRTAIVEIAGGLGPSGGSSNLIADFWHCTFLPQASALAALSANCVQVRFKAEAPFFCSHCMMVQIAGNSLIHGGKGAGQHTLGSTVLLDTSVVAANVVQYPGVAPPPRSGAFLTYYADSSDSSTDAKNSVLFMHGGSGSGDATLGDTWLFYTNVGR